MRKILLATLVIMAFQTTQAQEAWELIQKSKSMNGGDAFKKFNSLKTIGILESQMGDIEIVMYQVHNKGFKQEFEIMGKKNYMIITPDASYQMMSIHGMKEPKKVDEKMHNLLKRYLNLRGEYEKKEKVEYELADAIDIEGHMAHRIWVFEQDMLARIIYLDVENLQKIREDLLIEPVKKGEHEIYIEAESEKVKSNVISMTYLKYDKTELGILLPKVIKSNMGTIVVKEYIVNPEISEKEFRVETKK